MKTWLLLGMMCVAFPGWAQQATTPTDDTIRELLEVTQMRKMLDDATVQMSELYDQLFETPADESMTAQQRESRARSRERLKQLLEEELNWEVMAPIYENIYRQSFTDEELKGLVAFYRTPTGRALIAKQPVVLRNLMKAMQDRMEKIGPRIEREMEERHEVRTPPARIERH